MVLSQDFGVNFYLKRIFSMDTTDQYLVLPSLFIDFVSFVHQQAKCWMTLRLELVKVINF
jgi:hypothetical protein